MPSPSSFTRHGAAAAVTTLAAAIVGAEAQPFGHPAAGVEYPQRANFTLWLVEEFEEPLDLDADPVWTWSDGALPEGQVRFVKEGIKFENGRMILEVNDESPVSPPQACSHAESTWVGYKPLTSGELRTRHNMFRYGYYEARLRAPMVQPGDSLINGNYISTMFAYRDAKFKHWREIDVEITGDGPGALTANVLSGEDKSFWSPEIESHVSVQREGLNLRADFHTYAFEWLPSGITWYLDGEVVARHGANERLPIPELSGKILMNLWVFNGGIGFGGFEGVNNRYPMRSEYEWLRFYKWNGDKEYPCADMSDSCLTDDDRFLSGNNPCDGIEQLGTYPGLATCTAECTSPAATATAAAAATATATAAATAHAATATAAAAAVAPEAAGEHEGGVDRSPLFP